MSAETQGETFVMKAASSQQNPIEFTTFVLGLASTALIHLGEAPHPDTGQAKADLLLAKESLELLSLLRQKTQGNLTREEELLFDQVLADLRMRYVGAAKR